MSFFSTLCDVLHSTPNLESSKLVRRDSNHMITSERTSSRNLRNASAPSRKPASTNRRKRPMHCRPTRRSRLKARDCEKRGRRHWRRGWKRIRNRDVKTFWMKSCPLRWVRQRFSKALRVLTPVLDPLVTTIRIRFPLKTYSQLTTPQAISAILSRFGATDESSIVISTNLKGKKEKTDKAPKMGSALVPFKQIGDAFAAVCASGRKDLGLDGIKISWVRGEEPAILEWLRKMGKLNSETGSSQLSAGGIKAELPQNQTKSSSDPFSSFPSSFVRLFIYLLSTN